MSDTHIENTAYVWVYQVLEDVDFNQHALPPGTCGRLSAAIDRLRAVAAPTAQIRLAEAMSLNIFLAERAIRERDASSADRLTTEIQSLGGEWMQIPLGLTSH